jgi:hypothetical protein
MKEPDVRTAYYPDLPIVQPPHESQPVTSQVRKATKKTATRGGTMPAETKEETKTTTIKQEPKQEKKKQEEENPYEVDPTEKAMHPEAPNLDNVFVGRVPQEAQLTPTLTPRVPDEGTYRDIYDENGEEDRPPEVIAPAESIRKQKDEGISPQSHVVPPKIVFDETAS